jgi:hypothetical protein
MKNKTQLICFFILFCGINILSFSFVAQSQNQLQPDNPAQSSNASSNQNEYSDEQLNNAGNTSTLQTADGQKCGTGDIMLNISIPFVGRCIKKDPTAAEAQDTKGNSTIGNVFPKLMGGLIRLVMTAIYIIWFLGILVGGFMITASGADPSLKEKGKSLIVMIIGWLILLGASWIILNLINPDFFWVGS